MLVRQGQKLLICWLFIIWAGCSGELDTADRIQHDIAEDFEDVAGDAVSMDAYFSDAEPGADANTDADGLDVNNSGEDASEEEMDVDLLDASPQDVADPELPCAAYPRKAIGTPALSANWRYGGGDGYPDVIRRDDRCMTIVQTRAQLLTALSNATRGEIVYVDDNASIDLSGESVCIPGGVWLASGRGVSNSPGGLLFTTRNVKDPVLKVCGANVRITGLRLLGGDAGVCPAEWPDNCTGTDRTGGKNCRDCMPSSVGIRVQGYKNTEIDNTEIAGFSHAGINLSNATDVHIHHNDIHHTQRQGLGYGVVLMRGGTDIVTALIEWNRFDHFRHAIAGSGESGQSFHARNNLTGANASGHVFDMHGENEYAGNGSTVAGGRIDIHENIVLAGTHYAMVIRGKPQTGAWLHDNCLAQTNQSSAALQRFFTGNFYVDRSPAQVQAPNQYGQTANTCERVRMCYWPGGNGPRKTGIMSTRSAANLGLADLDGDGKTDVFYASGTTWQWARSGTASWQDLNSSSATLDRLAFGDFDGDGKDDVFTVSGGEWRVSDGGTKSWRTLRQGSEAISTLLFGDFDGDGKTDVFRATGSKWQWSRSGTAAWADLRASTATVAQLAVGDFNGDGKDDIFIASNNQWQYAPGGKGALVVLNQSSTARSSLHFGDFDGDGKTDVVHFAGNEWRVSWGGTSRWQRLRLAAPPRAPVKLGDFDGDGHADVFETHCL